MPKLAEQFPGIKRVVRVHVIVTNKDADLEGSKLSQAQDATEAVASDLDSLETEAAGVTLERRWLLASGKAVRGKQHLEIQKWAAGAGQPWHGGFEVPSSE